MRTFLIVLLPCEHSGYLLPSFEDDSICLYVKSAIPDHTPRHALEIYMLLRMLTTASILCAASSLPRPDHVFADPRARRIAAHFAPCLHLDCSLRNRRLSYSASPRTICSCQDGNSPPPTPALT
jgi:hypothetical protein